MPLLTSMDFCSSWDDADESDISALSTLLATERALRQTASHLRSFLTTSFCISSSASFLAFLCLYDSPVGKCFPLRGATYLITARILFALGLPEFSSARSCSISRVSSRLCVVMRLTSFAMTTGDMVSGSSESLRMSRRSSSDSVDWPIAGVFRNTSLDPCDAACLSTRLSPCPLV